MRKTHAVWLKREGKGETFDRTMRIDLEEDARGYAFATFSIMGASMWVEAIELKAELDENGADVAVEPLYQSRLDSVGTEFEHGRFQRARFDQREWAIFIVPHGT